MAKDTTSGNVHSDDYTTGRPARDEQMRAIARVQGIPKRQCDLPPFVAEKANVPPGPVTREED